MSRATGRPRSNVVTLPGTPGTCDVCEQPMVPGGGCTVTVVAIARHEHARVAYGDDRELWPAMGIDPPDACHDCGVAVGQVHHFGCDMEVCPAHGGQLLFCPDCTEVRL